MPTLKLTQDLVSKGLPCLEAKAKTEHCDTQTPGLRVEVTARSPNKATYYFAVKEGGKRKHHRLGTTAEMNLEHARELAIAIRERSRHGHAVSNPQVPNSDLTVSDFFEHHYMPHVQRSKRSWRPDE